MHSLCMKIPFQDPENALKCLIEPDEIILYVCLVKNNLL